MTASIKTEPELVSDAIRDADPVMELGLAPHGYRLPVATRLGHVSLQIADLSRSIEYYERVLGLHALERTATAAMLGTHEGAMPIVHLTERAGATPSPHHARLGLYHYAILLPNRPALGRFISHLGEIGETVGAADHLVSEALYLRDPDGLGIEVYADRPRSSWAMENRQLKMASNPLDFDDVVRSAEGQRWAGMPGGTVMGHVHLHVADLDRAAAFYHAALGLDKMVWSYPGALFLAAGGYHHHLGLNTWAGAAAPRPTDADARLLEWRIILPSAIEVQRAAASLASSGFAVVADGDDCIATDPWGTSVRLAC
ncbi:MAG: VOC family protein [bacterium]